VSAILRPRGRLPRLNFQQGGHTLECPADFTALNFKVSEYRDPAIERGRKHAPLSAYFFGQPTAPTASSQAPLRSSWGKPGAVAEFFTRLNFELSEYRDPIGRILRGLHPPAQF
jgi:hypothetical protein